MSVNFKNINYLICGLLINSYHFFTAAFHESVLHDGDVSKTMGNLTTQMSNISISARRSMKVVPANNSSPVRESLFRTVLGLVEEEDETDCESKDGKQYL